MRQPKRRRHSTEQDQLGEAAIALDEVRYRVAAGRLAVLTLAAPLRRNALTPAMSRAIVARIEQAEKDRNVAALVLNAEGPSFSAGADRALLGKISRDPLQATAYESLGAIYEMFGRLASSAVPTVAAVNGAIVGASVNLALACDVRLVSDDVRVVGFHVANLHPGGGHLTLLARSLGLMWGAALALFAQELDASTAVSSGFAIASMPASKLEEAAIALGARAAADVELTRRVTSTWRTASTEHLSHKAAAQLERAAQMWSLRRQSAL